jgi:hypothetical protein
MPLDVFSVHDGQIHTESIKKEYGLAEGWWSNYRVKREAKVCLALGAVEDKPPVVWPEAPRLALGIAAKRPVEDTFGMTSSMREFDQECISSELRDWMRESGHFSRRPHHKKGIPSYYGRTLHGTSADGTDTSSRAH